MDTNQMTEQKLWDYIDGHASPEDKNFVDSILSSNAEWNAKYNELLAFNKLVHATELEAPSMRFTRNVMDDIARLHIAPATKSYINRKIIWGLGFFFIAMFVGFFIYGFGQMSSGDSGESTIAKNLPRFDMTKMFNNTWVNIFMMINVVLALVLLDHYFASKRKEFKKHT